MNIGGSQGSMSGYKRRRVMTSLGRYLRQKAAPMKVSRLMRSIGLPAQMHTFARPGNRIQVYTDNTGNLVSNLANYGLTFSSTTGGRVNGTVDFGGSISFALSRVSSVADLTGLYDNYRIKSVSLRIDLSFNQAPAVTQAGANWPASGFNSLPIIHMAYDPDDAAVPGTAEAVLQYTKSFSRRLGDLPIQQSCIPRAQGAVQVGTGTTTAVGGVLPLQTWLDTGSTQVEHYGFKFFIENMPRGVYDTTSSSANWVLTFTPVYLLQMKNVH